MANGKILEIVRHIDFDVLRVKNAAGHLRVVYDTRRSHPDQTVTMAFMMAQTNGCHDIQVTNEALYNALKEPSQWPEQLRTVSFDPHPQPSQFPEQLTVSQVTPEQSPTPPAPGFADSAKSRNPREPRLVWRVGSSSKAVEVLPVVEATREELQAEINRLHALLAERRQRLSAGWENQPDVAAPPKPMIPLTALRRSAMSIGLRISNHDSA